MGLRLDSFPKHTINSFFLVCLDGAGRPCGGEAFIKKLEQKFSYRLKALPYGRPRKVKLLALFLFMIFYSLSFFKKSLQVSS